MSNPLFSMLDKICVITGGSRGLGKAMATAFLNAGAKRVYVTARKPHECARTAEELSALTELLPLLRAGGSAEKTASVINIGSIAGMLGNAGSGLSYSVSKTAIHQLTRNLANLLADDHIRVNAIAPGRFHSKMTSTVEQDREQYEREIKMIPLHRWGSDEDIMGPALLLASNAGAFMTGGIITVDGGYMVV